MSYFPAQVPPRSPGLLTSGSIPWRETRVNQLAEVLRQEVGHAGGMLLAHRPLVLVLTLAVARELGPGRHCGTHSLRFGSTGWVGQGVSDLCHHHDSDMQWFLLLGEHPGWEKPPVQVAGSGGGRGRKTRQTSKQNIGKLGRKGVSVALNLQDSLTYECWSHGW